MTLSRKKTLTIVAFLIFFLLPKFALASSSDDPAQFQDLEDIFARIIGIVLSLAGIAVFIMLLIGGFRYLTAGDNPKQAEQASKTFTFAVIGLILIISSWFVLRLIQEITGLNVTIFKIPE